MALRPIDAHGFEWFEQVERYLDLPPEQFAAVVNYLGTLTEANEEDTP